MRGSGSLVPEDLRIVSALTEGRSVDYVTKPAAGGAIVAVLEAMGHPQSVEEARNIGAWLESRLHLALTQLGDDMYGNGRLSRTMADLLLVQQGAERFSWGAGDNLIADGNARQAYLDALRAADAGRSIAHAVPLTKDAPSTSFDARSGWAPSRRWTASTRHLPDSRAAIA